MSDHHDLDQPAGALDAHWDAPQGPHALDQSLADTVHRLHAAPDVPGPDPSFVAELQESLMPTTMATTHPNGRSPLATLPTPAPSTALPRRWPTTPRRPARLWVAVAAALVAAALTGGFAFDIDRGRDRGDVVPALSLQHATPSSAASPVSADGTLVEITLPADVLSDRDAATLDMVLFTVPAGSTTTWTGADPACCAGQTIMHVLEGSSTFTPGATAYILRAGSDRPAELIVGEAAEVAPGDTLITREELPWVWTVSDLAPLRLVAGWILIGPGMAPPDQSHWVYEDAENLTSIVLPAEPLTLLLRLVSLEPGATLPAGSAIAQIALSHPDSDARLSTLSGGAVKNSGAEPADLYVLSLSPAPADAEVVIAGAPPVPATPVPSPTLLPFTG